MSLAKATEQLSRALDRLESSTMPITKTRLDERPARKVLTSREAAKLLGANLGGLLELADRETVRTALKWWSEQGDEAWDYLENLMNEAQTKERS